MSLQTHPPNIHPFVTNILQKNEKAKPFKGKTPFQTDKNLPISQASTVSISKVRVSDEKSCSIRKKSFAILRKSKSPKH